MSWILSQSDTTERAARALLYGSLVFIVIILVAWIVFVIAKRRAEAAQQAGSRTVVPFTLHDLRELHADGQLSDEEFQKAREKIVAMSKAALARQSGPKPEVDLKTRLRAAAEAAGAGGDAAPESDPPAAGDFEAPKE